MNQPLVSIVTPAYNHARYIGACIDSVVSQTYPHWEMIIVDDGSTDRTWEIVSEYAAHDPRIRAFRQQNRGIWRLAETYNFALDQCKGDLIAVLEGDDLWPPDKLARQVPAHLSSNCALSFGRIQYVDGEGDLLSPDSYPNINRLTFFRDPNPRDLVVRLIRGDYFVPALTATVSTSLLRKIGGFQQPPYLPVVDYPTWIAIGSTDGGFLYVDELLGYFRQTPSQATWVLSREIAQGAYRFVQEMMSSSQFGPELVADLRRYDPHESLLSRNRRGFLATSSYRAAVVASDRGERARAVRYCFEIARFRRWHWFGRCWAMLARKELRRLTRRISANDARPSTRSL